MHSKILSISFVSILIMIGCDAESNKVYKPVMGIAQTSTKANISTAKGCLSCHHTFQKEKFSKAHIKKKVKCTKCHGPSLAHSLDKKHLTPPDIMFQRGKLKTTCLKCHKEDKLVKVQMHKITKAFDAKPKLSCAKCHTKKHRIAKRKIYWDKTTRKLVSNKTAEK